MEEELDRKVAQGFTKLKAACGRKQHKKVLKHATELLEVVPEDGTAKHCKLVALIHLGQLEKAHGFANKKSQWGDGELVKERAYCYYRNGNLSKALGMVLEAKGEGSETEGTLELKGQLLYRLGRMEESKKVYQELLSKQKQGFLRSKVTADLLGNIIAAYIAAGEASEVATVLKQLKATKKSLEETPEIAYNNACTSLALGQYETAMDLLQVAERVGYESLYEDDMTEEEMKEELAHVFAQKAFVQHKLGNDKESVESNMQVLKNISPEDVTLAIATNNLVAARGNSNVFDSLKKFDKLQSKGSGQGLEIDPEMAEGLQENEIVELLTNYAILSLLGNKFDAVEKTALGVLKLKPNSMEAVVLQAMALLKKDKKDKAFAVLDDFGRKYKDENSVDLHLAKCHLAASCSSWKVAAEALLSVPEEIKFQPAALATMLHLFGKCNESSQAMAAVDGATEWWDAQMVSPSASSELAARYASAMKIAGRYKYEQKDLDGAAALYQKVLAKTEDPTLRSEAMAGLVQLHGVDDSALADKYESEMPVIPGIEEIDVELLEQTTMKVKRQPMSAPGASSSAAKSKEGESRAFKSAAAGQATQVEEVFVTRSKAQQRREFLKTLPPERQEYVLKRQKEQKKRKAKRRAKAPAGLDPNNPTEPDPERWIAKRDRSSYKKTRKEKKKEKNVVKGSQGAGKVNEMLDRSSAPLDKKAAPNLPARGRRKR